MRFSFNVYPEAVSKLKDSGLVDKFDKIKDDEDFPSFYGAIFSDEIGRLSLA